MHRVSDYLISIATIHDAVYKAIEISLSYSSPGIERFQKFIFFIERFETIRNNQPILIPISLSSPSLPMERSSLWSRFNQETPSALQDSFPPPLILIPPIRKTSLFFSFSLFGRTIRYSTDQICPAPRYPNRICLVKSACVYVCAKKREREFPWSSSPIVYLLIRR